MGEGVYSPRGEFMRTAQQCIQRQGPRQPWNLGHINLLESGLCQNDLVDTHPHPTSYPSLPPRPPTKLNPPNQSVKED